MSAEKKEEKKKAESKEKETKKKAAAKKEKSEKKEEKKPEKDKAKEEKKEKEKKEEKKAEKKEEKGKEEKKEEEKKPEEGKEDTEEEKAVEAESENVKKIVEMVKSLSVMELSELVGVLEDLFGVSAAAPMAIAPGAVGAAAEEEEEEQTEFDVVLKEIGSQKIQVIKVVRSVTDLGLIDAKKLVEGAPETVKEGLSKDEAEEVKGKLEEVGATIELK